MERLLKSKLPRGQFTTSPVRSRAMAAVRGHGNRTTELRLRMALVRAGVKGWTYQYRGLAGKPDFFFPKAKLAVFVDGCFWHGCPRCGHVPKAHNAFWTAKLDRNRKRHHKVGRLLRKEGIGTLRLWEHQLRLDLDHCVEKIRHRLRRRK